MSTLWQFTEEDADFFERELKSFIPDRVYDIHAHLWRQADWQDHAPEIVQSGPPEITLEVYREMMSWLLPDIEVHGLHFQFPTFLANVPDACNRLVSQEIKKDSFARGQYYVRPDDEPERVRDEMKRLGLRGFKPFACFANRDDIQNAEIPEFFPEWIARLAHEENWSVTLHMMRARSLADSSNQHWIQEYCTRYPGMILILDHCARGFNPSHAIEGLSKMKRFQNLFADTSVVCAPLAVMACIRYLGVENVLYGSDFFCSHIRGTNIPVGDTFVWIEDRSPVWGELQYEREPVLLGLENLRAIKQACEILALKDRDVEAIFWGNAARILGL